MQTTNNVYFLHAGVTEGNSSKLYRSGYRDASLCAAALPKAQASYTQGKKTGTITIINANPCSAKAGLITYYVYTEGVLVHQGNMLPVEKRVRKPRAAKKVAVAKQSDCVLPVVAGQGEVRTSSL